MADQAPPAAPGGGGKLAAKVGGPRNLAIIGAGGTVALVGLITFMRKKSSAATPATTPSAYSPTASPYDSTQYDMWNTWQAQYENLQQQVNSMQAGQTSAAGPGVPTPQPPPVPIPVPIRMPPIPAPGPHPAPPPPQPKPPTTAHKTVTVQRGDTLSGIASKNGISLATLRQLNPKFWSDPKYQQGNMIWSGAKVIV